VNHFGLFEQQSPQEIEQILLTNSVAPMLLCHALLPSLRSRGEAHIVNVGSILGSIAMPGNAAYSASKFALHGFSEALRRELADSRVRVHYVAPRATATAFNDAGVNAMNRELKVAVDPPEVVALAVMTALVEDRSETFIGWPERLFVRLNGLLPRLVDQALRKQLPIVQRYAKSLPSSPSDPGSVPPGPHREVHANG
jgi:short-subunit dehydrogenase